MAVACRKVISELWDSGLNNPSNASLLMDRYLQIPVKTKDEKQSLNNDTKKKDDAHQESKKKLYNQVKISIKNTAPLYNSFYERESKRILSSKKKSFSVRNRLIIGLGGENVLETGLTLHRIYGVPYIPGTALKGLAAHYCHQILGKARGDPDYCTGGKYHAAIFGTTDDSGHFIFHDGLINPDCLTDCLHDDIMTPHHKGYYNPKDDDFTPPTDFDEPTPVLFLSVTGVFHIMISCDLMGNDAEKWTNLVFTILTRALAEHGIGGKTNAGYGRMDLIFDDSVSENHPLARKPGVKEYQAGVVVPVTREI